MNRLDSSFDNLDFDLALSIPRINRSFHTKSISSTLSLVEVLRLKDLKSGTSNWLLVRFPLSCPFFPFPCNPFLLIFPSSFPPSPLNDPSLPSFFPIPSGVRVYVFHPPTLKHICLIFSYLFFFHSPIPTGDTFGCSAPTVSTTWATTLNPSLFINSSFATDPQPCLRIPQVRVCLKQSLSRPTSKPKLPTDVLPVPDGRVARRTTRPRHPKPRRKRLKKQKKKIRKSQPVVAVLEKNRLRQQPLGKRPNWRLLGTKPPQGLLLFRQTLVLHPHPRHSQHRLRLPSLLKLLSLRLRLFLHLLLLLLLLLFQHTPRHTLKALIPRLLLLPIPCRNNTRLGHSRNLRHLNPLKLLLARVVRTLIPFDPLLTILLLRLRIVRLLSMWYHPGTTIAPARRPRSLASLTRRRKAPTLSKHHCTALLPVMSRPYTLQRLLPQHQHLHTTL